MIRGKAHKMLRKREAYVKRGARERWCPEALAVRAMQRESE